MLGLDRLFVEVKIEGEVVSDLLLNLQVEESDSQTDIATLTFGDSEMILSDIFHEGLTVEVDLGMESLHALVFSGIITGIRATFPTSGEPQLEVQAIENLIQLGFEPKTKQWSNTPIMAIVQEIAMKNGFVPGVIQPTVDTVVMEDRPIQQIAETDLAFLLRLAKDYDAKLAVTHLPIETLNFVSSKTLVSTPPIVPNSLIWGANLTEFTTSFDAFAPQRNKQIVTTDPLTASQVAIPEDPVLEMEEQTAVLDAVWMPDSVRLLRLGLGAVRMAKITAKSAAKRAQLNDYWQAPSRVAGAASRLPVDLGETFGDHARRLGQTGQGKAEGNCFLHPQTNVMVEGVSGRWSGKWYVAEVTHQVDVQQRNYTCEFTCTR
jgi:phage protein D